MRYMLALNARNLFQALIIELFISMADDNDDGTKQLAESMQQIIHMLYEERYDGLFQDTDMEMVLERYYLIFNELCSMLEDLPED